MEEIKRFKLIFIHVLGFPNLIIKQLLDTIGANKVDPKITGIARIKIYPNGTVSRILTDLQPNEPVPRVFSEIAQFLKDNVIPPPDVNGANKLDENIFAPNKVSGGEGAPNLGQPPQNPPVQQNVNTQTDHTHPGSQIHNQGLHSNNHNYQTSGNTYNQGLPHAMEYPGIQTNYVSPHGRLPEAQLQQEHMYRNPYNQGVTNQNQQGPQTYHQNIPVNPADPHSTIMQTSQPFIYGQFQNHINNYNNQILRGYSQNNQFPQQYHPQAYHNQGNQYGQQNFYHPGNFAQGNSFPTQTSTNHTDTNGINQQFTNNLHQTHQTPNVQNTQETENAKKTETPGNDNLHQLSDEKETKKLEDELSKILSSPSSNVEFDNLLKGIFDEKKQVNENVVQTTASYNEASPTTHNLKTPNVPHANNVEHSNTQHPNVQHSNYQQPHFNQHYPNYQQPHFNQHYPNYQQPHFNQHYPNYQQPAYNQQQQQQQQQSYYQQVPNQQHPGAQGAIYNQQPPNQQPHYYQQASNNQYPNHPPNQQNINPTQSHHETSNSHVSNSPITSTEPTTQSVTTHPKSIFEKLWNVF